MLQTAAIPGRCFCQLISHIIKHPGAGKAKQKPGSLTFVDLAGSERAGDTMYHSVEQIKQTAEINTSLAALKVRTSKSPDCICCLECSTLGSVHGSVCLRPPALP